MNACTEPFTHHAIARVVVETLTPLSLVTGHTQGIFDTALLRDANGLPTIPGTALAGVLRSLVRRCPPKIETVEPIDRHLFGYQSGDGGQASRVQLSWASLLDSQGRTNTAIRTESGWNDPLLALASRVDEQELRRDRVRIGHRGAAADTGHFDRSILPAGFRFAFELGFWHHNSPDDQACWEQLCQLLAHPLFRLGAATRSGLGRLRTVSVHRRSFDLKGHDTADITDYASLSIELHDTQGLQAWEPGRVSDPQLLDTRIVLEEPVDFWRIGGGDRPVGRHQGHDPDLLPRQEPRVRWTAQGPHIDTHVLIPASAVKGPLAHRSRFHVNCLQGRWAEELEAATDQAAESEAVIWLFGSAKSGGKRAGPETGMAGRVFLDDAFLQPDPAAAEQLMHNAIDRFTGGVRARMLFSEEVLNTGRIELPLLIDLAPRHPDDAIHSDALAALRQSLEDLISGRLAIGAGASRGYGRFRGQRDCLEALDQLLANHREETPA